MRKFVFGGSYASAVPFVNEYSMLFDGVDELFSQNSISAFRNSTAFSISCWVKKLDSTYDLLLGQYTLSSNAVFVGIDVTETRRIDFAVRNGQTASYGYSTTELPKNEWHHLAFVYNGSGASNADRMQIYLDGVSLILNFSQTIPSSTGNNTQVFRIGAATLTNYWNGNIDEVSVFDYSLDASQASAIYNAGSPADLLNTTGVTPPVHWFRMGDLDTWGGSSWTINDVGTLGTNNGTSINMEEADRVTDVP